MQKEKTVKVETYRSEDKIKRKTRVNNLEDFYDFCMPYKDETIHTKKSMKVLKAVTISSFLPFLAVVFFFLVWNTIHVVMDGRLEKETIQTYIFICIFLVLLLVYKKKNEFRFDASGDYDIHVLDCQVWSLQREPIESFYSYYAAVCTETQFCNEYIAIQNYTYNCLMDNADEQMLLVMVKPVANYSGSQKPLFYLQTKENLSIFRKKTPASISSELNSVLNIKKYRLRFFKS